MRGSRGGWAGWSSWPLGGTRSTNYIAAAGGGGPLFATEAQGTGGSYRPELQWLVRAISTRGGPATGTLSGPGPPKLQGLVVARRGGVAAGVQVLVPSRAWACEPDPRKIVNHQAAARILKAAPSRNHLARAASSSPAAPAAHACHWRPRVRDRGSMTCRRPRWLRAPTTRR